MVRGIIPALSIDLGRLIFLEEEEGEATMCDVQCTKTNVNGFDALVSIISTFQSTKKFQCTTLYRRRLEGLECNYF